MWKGIMLKTNYLIINREVQKFSEMKMFGGSVEFFGIEGNVFKQITLDKSVYAGLYCDEVHNVTLVVDKEGHQDVITILWCSEPEYQACKQTIENSLSMKLSRQNIKLNRYAEDIAAKLANGVKLLVVDAPMENDMVECPECGMMSPKGTPYCVDCGAEL